MQTEILPAGSNETLPSALAVLKAGGLVAFPTDTVYGVGALAFDGEAVESIYVAKARPLEKAIPVLVGDSEDIAQVGADIPPVAYQLAARFWPGPLTILVPKCLDLPESVSATATVGLRVPDHPIARALLRAAGPMAVTSANISGMQSPVTAEEVYEQLGSRIPLIIDGGRTPGGVLASLRRWWIARRRNCSFCGKDLFAWRTCFPPWIPGETLSLLSG
jgi:L-threonylcarbamoyladenylate synthase